MTRPVFIISTGRTGTKALAKILDAIVEKPSQVRHEPQPDLFHLAMGFQRGLNLRQAIKQFRKERGDAPPEGVQYVESNGNCAWLVPLIREVWPSSRFVMVVRDPRTWIRSAMSHGAGWKARRADLRPSADSFPGDPFAQHWPAMSPVQRMAWVWMRKNERMLSSGVDNVWKYELLFDHAFHIVDMAESAGLQVVPRAMNATVDLMQTRWNASDGYDIPEWPLWAPGLRASVLDICGELMATFGYE